MGERIQGPEVLDIAAAKIRAHQLPMQELVSRGAFSPLRMAEMMNQDTRQLFDDPREYSHDRRYAKDILKEDTDTSCAVYTLRLAQALSRIPQTQGNELVAIVVGIPGALCDAPLEGNHCPMRNQREFGNASDAVASDLKWFERFLSVAESILHTRERITVGKTYAYFTDAPAEIVPYALISAEDLQTVFRYSDFEGMRLADEAQRQ